MSASHKDLTNRNTLEEKEQSVTLLDQVMPHELMPIIASYLDKEVDEKEDKSQQQLTQNPFHYQRQFFFFSNVTQQYATHIAHNLVWNVNIDETLEFAKINPQSLLVNVEIKDPHGQRYYNTPLKILLSLGERNPFECKEEKDFGLVERLIPCFSDVEAAKEQIKEWEKDRDTATAITMAPYKKAIDNLCDAIIESKEITNDKSWEQLLNLPIAAKFKEALKPNPNHIVNAGFSWDIQIFLYFFEVWENKIKELGGWPSLKSDLFGTIVYPALQARMSRGDYCFLDTGLVNVFSNKKMPGRDNYVNGVPPLFQDIGDSLFSPIGNKCAERGRGVWGRVWRMWGGPWGWDAVANLMSSKKSGLTKFMRQHTRATKNPCLVM